MRTVAETEDQAICVGVDLVPRVVIGGSNVFVYRLAGGGFVGSTVDSLHRSGLVTIASGLDGHTRVAWFGRTPDGIWVSHD